MSKKPTYQDLERRVKKLEREVFRYKQVENELRASEDKFKKIFDNANIIIWGCYADGKIKIFNKEAERVTGYTQEEALGMINMSLHPPEEREEILEKFKRHKEGVLKKDLELGIYTKDKKRLRVLLAQATFKDATGEDFYIALMQDITKRKQAEENIRFLSSIVEQSSEGMAVANLEGVLLFINHAWARMHGYELADELIGKHLDIFHNKEQLRTQVRPFNDKVMKNGFHVGEVDHIRRDGTCFTTLMTTTLLKDAQERPFAIAGIAKDITKRKKVEKELARHRYQLEDLVKERTAELEKLNKQLLQEISDRKQAEEKLREFNSLLSSLIDSPSDVIVLSVDKDYNYTFFNSAHVKEMKRVWGVDIELGKCLLDYIPNPKVRDNVKKNFGRILKGEKLKIEKAYGEGENRFWYELAYNPIHNDKGCITGFTIYITNISERKKTEEAICIYQNKLRSLASELSLAEERERRHIATDLHDYIGQSLSIARIKLKAFQESVSPVDLQDLEEIQKLIEQAIKYTRSLMFELSPPMLYDLGFEAAVEWLVEKIATQHGISVSFMDDKRNKLLDNEVRIILFQAVRELLVNIAKHGQASNAKVSVYKAGNFIQIDVVDDGIGFDTSKIGSYKNETSGFGLFNIRERLDYLGGDFEIRSKPGQGTSVTLMAPLKTNESHII